MYELNLPSPHMCSTQPFSRIARAENYRSIFMNYMTLIRTKMLSWLRKINEGDTYSLTAYVRLLDVGANELILNWNSMQEVVLR
jgi:hypothetical protein